jgi:hypothetical protein
LENIKRQSQVIKKAENSEKKDKENVWKNF